MLTMNKYSKIMVFMSLIIFLTAEFYDERAVYIAFAVLIAAFFLPHFVTIATGQHYRGE